MHLVVLLGLIAVPCLNSSVQFEVPDSVSPNNGAALYYEHAVSAPGNEGYELYFRHPQSLLPLSGNLVPAERADCTTSAANADMESDILLDGIGSDLEALRRHVLPDPAFSYFVAWSPDSQWVSIEGGAHKFWRVMIYHFTDGEFQGVELPEKSSFCEYFHAREARLVVNSLGVAAAIQKISTRRYDYPEVCWTGNGLPAINARLYLLNDPEYEKLETRSDPRYKTLDSQDFFYLLDARTHPATVTGFCR